MCFGDDLINIMPCDISVHFDLFYLNLVDDKIVNRD